MEEALRGHEVWPWLSQLRGIGVTLAARLLARLDIRRAPTPSSFWSYCGLATVPARIYQCVACGVTSVAASGRSTRNRHRTPDGEFCSGPLSEIEASGPVRVAQPGPRRGEVAAYDRQAKKLCYLIGVSFLRSRSVYRAVYDRERSRLERERADWPKGRQHLAALRKMEKVFLSHLWAKWAEAAGIPDVRPYGEVRGLTQRMIPPEP
jgi:hypothetical protein